MCEESDCAQNGGGARRFGAGGGTVQRAQGEGGEQRGDGVLPFSGARAYGQGRWGMVLSEGMLAPGGERAPFPSAQTRRRCYGRVLSPLSRRHGAPFMHSR